MDTHFVVAVLLVFLRPRLYGGGRQGRSPPVNSNKENSIKGQQVKFRILFKGIGDVVCVQISVPNRPVLFQH